MKFKTVLQIEIIHSLTFGDSVKNEYSQIILDIFNNEYTVNPDHLTNPAICCILGDYCLDMEEYDKMKEWYNIAMSYNYPDAFANLGYYYQTIENDMQMAKHYYDVGINNPTQPNANCMCHWGNYLIYDCKKQQADGLKYLMDAVELKSAYAMYCVGSYYKHLANNCKSSSAKNYKHYENMIKYYEMASQNGCAKSSMALSNHYHIIANDIELNKYYLNLAGNQGCGRAWFIQFQTESDKTKKMEYIQKGADLLDFNCVCAMGLRATQLKNLELVEYYFRTACELKNSFAQDLTHVMDSTWNHPCMSDSEFKLNYYILSVELGCMNCEKLQADISKEELYHVLLSKQNKSKNIEQKLTELRTNSHVNDFINKLSMAKEFNMTKECILCFETALHIPLKCFHTCCVSCSFKLKKCFACNRRLDHKIQLNRFL